MKKLSFNVVAQITEGVQFPSKMRNLASMLGLLIFLFTVIPALELYLLFKVGASIGAGNTILIIILTGVVGASLAKAQGMALLLRIQNELNQGQVPATELVHGLLVFGGGLLLLTPGFVTDILGFAMVIPGTRHLLVQFAKSYFKRGIANGNIHVFTNFNFHQYDDSQIKNDSNTIEADYERKE